MHIRTLAAVGLSLIAGAAAAGPLTLAEEPMTRQEQRVVNFAYATRLGSGVYDVAGRSVQVYRLPFSWTARAEDRNKTGLRVRLPLTIGFIDFKPTDVAATGIPSELDTASFIPGLEVRLLLSERWRLMPSLEVGVANDRRGEASSTVASVGVRSVAAFAPGRFRLTLGNELLHTWVDPSTDPSPETSSEPAPKSESFASFETCFEARHDMGFSIGREDADFGLYATQYLSWNNPHFPLREAGPDGLQDQYEIGVTFGTREKLRVMKIGLPRLGVGYRFAHGVSIFRVVIGIPSPSLES